MIGIIMITEPINQEFLNDLKLKHNVRLITQDLAPDLLIFEHDTIAEVFQQQIGGMMFDINYLFNNHDQTDEDWKFWELMKGKVGKIYRNYRTALFIGDYCFSIVAGSGCFCSQDTGMIPANYDNFEMRVTGGTEKQYSCHGITLNGIIHNIEECLPKDFFNK